MDPQLKQRLTQQIERLEHQLQQLNINADAFAGWFDPQLFNQDVDHPHDYIHELRRNLRRLEQATTSQRSQWLSEHLAHQLRSLHQAITWYLREQPPRP